MKYQQIIKKLKSLANPENVSGMARFGINPQNTLGISIPNLRLLAKKIGKDHKLAQKLWDSEIHEARILAGFIDDPKEATEQQMDSWVKDFDSWDVCDQVCANLFDKTPYAYKMAIKWAGQEKEFVKRAGFALMAALAWHDKEASDESFYPFFPLIKEKATDERNFVKKAVNWALRQIGKKNLSLNKKAIDVAREVQKVDSKAAQWIAKDALRELTSEKVQRKLKKA